MEEQLEEIEIIEKPKSISFEEIQDLLHRAHATNEKEGMLFSTGNQSIDTLKQKLNNAVCYVALMGEKLVGTGSIQFRKLSYWYHSGDIGLLKLAAVDPSYMGRHINTRILHKRIQCAWDRGITVCVADTAEQNRRMRHILEKNGFVLVDYCVYPGNNFFTVVYALWKSGCPHSDFQRKWHFFWKRCLIRLQYKPGKINRFTGKKG